MTTPDKLDVIRRPTPAKATLHDNGRGERLSGVVNGALQSSYGKQGAAAAALGKDPGNFSRDINAERLTLRDMRELGPTFLGELGEELVRQYGPLRDPKDEARRALREIEQKLDTVRQFIDAA